MALRDLQYRARRVALVTALVALVLTLLYLMSGLAHQLQTEPYDSVDNIGARTWVLADGVRGPFTAASVLPLAARDELAAQVDGLVEPIVVSRGSLEVVGPGRETLEIQMIGHRPGVLGEPLIRRGSPVGAPGEMVVDDSLDVDIGARVRIGIDEFTVVGWTNDSTVLAGQGLVFVELADAQRIAFQNDQVVTGFLSDAEIGEVSGFSVRSADAVAEETLGPIESAVSSIDLIRILLWFVAAIVMGAVIYLTALERQRDFAVLKAVGASGVSLSSGLALQAVIVALVASLVGAIAAKLIEPVFPLPVTIPVRALVTVPVVAVIVGLASALLGVRKVNRTDPAEAFG